MITNDTQRVLLSEQFTDDLYYTANVQVVRTEVFFNQDTVVFVKLANDSAPITLSLPACEIETFITHYTAYQREQQAEQFFADASTFRAWLEARSGLDQTVGDSYTGLTNPVALWLSEVYGKPYGVGSRGYGPAETDEMRDTPWWMRAFLEKLYAGPQVPNLDPTYALTVLDDVTSLDDLDEHPF